MDYATVCSGAEAFGPAWHELGYEPVFHAEIDNHASAVLRYRYPAVPNYGDFTQIATHDGPQPTRPVQLLCGGTPCQTFSVAGLREGLDSYKGGLTLEFVKLAQRLGAQWLLWENVPGVLSADGGEAFGSFLGALAECGYGFAYRVLDLQHFGCPQRRKRVFVVGYLGDWRVAAAVLFESESLSGDFAKGGKKRPDITQALTSGLGSGGPDAAHAQAGWLVPAVQQYLGNAEGDAGLPFLTCSNISKHANNQMPLVGSTQPAIAFTTEQTPKFSKETALTLTQGSPSGGGQPQCVLPPVCVTGLHTHALTAEGFDASEDGTGRGTPIVVQPAQIYQDSEYGVKAYDSAGTRRAGRIPEHQMIIEPTACFKQGAGAQAGSIGYQENISPTLTGASSGTQQSPALLHQSAVRRLTPTECERLMGWADGWTQYGINAKGQQYELADGPRYRICGNGWGQPVVSWIASRIKLVQALLDAE